MKIRKLGILERQEVLWDIVYLAPQFTIYLLMTVVPFIVALPMVFTDRVNFVDQEYAFIGFDNFRTIFKPPIADIFLPAVARTAVFVAINLGMIFVFGMTLALIMYEFRKSRFRRYFFVIIYLPFMMSGVGVGLLVNMLFSRDSGSLNLLLMHSGILDTPINIKDPLVTTIALPLMVGWRYAGYNMAIFLSGLLAIPESTIEAAIVDGTSYMQRVWYIYFPQMMGSILIAVIFCLIGSFGIFDEPVGMGGLYANKNAEFLSIVLVTFGFGGSTDVASGTLAQAIAMSLSVYLPLFFIAYFLTIVQKKLQY